MHASSPFVRAPETLLILDTIARRYGILPHDVLELSPYQLTLAWQCYLQANATIAQRLKSSDGMIFPVFDIGG